MATPTWSAARSGLLGDTGAVNAAAQVNQLLGTHAIAAVYQGNSILTPNGSGGTAWNYHLDAYDVAQPFVMSGSTIGRVVVPLLPVGQGADLIVSLYSNNSGVPGTLINQCRIPADWINSLAAVSGVAGPSSSTPTLQYTGSPLALGQFNSFHMGTTKTTNWPLPYNTSGFAAITACQAWTGNWIILVGGNNGGSTFFNSVFTISCDSEGNVSQAIPQPGMPSVNDGTAVVEVVTDPTSGNQTIVVAGGQQTSGTPTNAVYTASFNPTTGQIASWSQQTNLPAALNFASSASWNGFFYFLGGTTAANTDVTSVYYAQVVNGQITSWNTGPSLPVALDSMYANAINGFLVVYGGETAALTHQSTCWYAPINANGSLGPWLTGPQLPSTAVQFQLASPQLGTYGVLGVSSNLLYALGVSPNGLDVSWQTQSLLSGGSFLAMVPVQPGQWYYYGLNQPSYVSMPIALTPRISVPLPTTGLSNGTTYHIVLSQPGGTLNDYLRTHDDLNVFPGTPTSLTRAKGSSTWTAGTTGHAIPLQVFDQTVLGKVWHLWEDGGARISTLAWGTTPNQPLLGLLEATTQPGPVLNQWPTFVQGVGPWHPTGGTFTQSNAQTHGNLPFSGLLTPSGSASLSFVESDLVPVQQGHSYLFTAQYYSPTGYSNVSVSVNWFDVNRNYISTTSGSATSIPSGTWTQFQTTATNNITNAVYADMVCIEGGTPPNTALLYVSAATVQDKSGPQVSSVLKYNYVTNWPSLGSNTGTGVTLLA